MLTLQLWLRFVLAEAGSCVMICLKGYSPCVCACKRKKKRETESMMYLELKNAKKLQ